MIQMEQIKVIIFFNLENMQWKYYK